jgi:hypothetical protein
LTVRAALSTLPRTARALVRIVRARPASATRVGLVRADA